MPEIQAFQGWRYDPGRVDYSDVTAPPYDVIGAEEQEALYARSPYNTVRLILNREEEADTPQNNRYTRAATHLDAWREEGLFQQDKPALYRYEQTFDADGATVSRTGFFARVLLGDWGENGVYPHEKTLAGPKVDRLNLMRAVRGNPGPVFGLLSDAEERLPGLVRDLASYDPVADFEDDAGVRNRLWVVDDPERYGPLLKAARAESIFIADGHHRYETALAYRNEVREAMRAAGRTPPELGELDCDYVLMAIVPETDPGLVIRPTHRLVYGVPEEAVGALPESAAAHFEITPVPDPETIRRSLETAAKPAFGLVLPDGMHVLTLRDPSVMDTRAPDAPRAWRELDVSVLHLLLLEDLLGIDEGKLLRKENIIYVKNDAEAIRMARAGESGVQAGFLVRPTEMRQVQAVARAGAVMPQKSTFFYPKILSGLVFHLFW